MFFSVCLKFCKSFTSTNLFKFDKQNQQSRYAPIQYGIFDESEYRALIRLPKALQLTKNKALDTVDLRLFLDS